MTPLYIEIGLHYHCRADEFERLYAPAVRDAVNHFVSYGLLREGVEGERRYEPTEGLRVWVAALCAVKWPDNTSDVEVAPELSDEYWSLR